MKKIVFLLLILNISLTHKIYGQDNNLQLLANIALEHQQNAVLPRMRIVEPELTQNPGEEEERASSSTQTSTRLLCDICNQTYANPTSLRRHKMIHTGEKPFMCQYCDQKFRAIGSLISHERSHIGERPYKCTYPDCDASFANKGNLLHHTRMHNKVKYACDYLGCGWSTTRTNLLKVHKAPTLLSLTYLIVKTSNNLHPKECV